MSGDKQNSAFELRINDYIGHLEVQIGTLEAQLQGAPLEESVSILEQISALHKLHSSSLKSLVIHYKSMNVRNKQQSESLWARKAFLQNAFTYLKTKNPDAIAYLASPDSVSEKEAHWVERAEAAWHPLERSEKLRKAVYRFAKQPEHWK